MPSSEPEAFQSRILPGDLGAHVAFTRQHTNSSVTQRLDALADFWKQLKGSAAGYDTKVRALRTVAWPRGLFAISSAPVAASTWMKHRRQAVQALNFDKADINPWLLLGLVEAAADPEFLALVHAVKDARVDSPQDIWASELFPI